MVKIPTFAAEGRITAEAPSVQTNVQIPLSNTIGTALSSVTKGIEDYYIKEKRLEADNKAARYLYKKCGYGEIDLSTNMWAREFTSKRLHKTPDSYVFLYKRLSSISQREILRRQSHVLSHMISSISSSPSPSSAVRESTSLF